MKIQTLVLGPIQTNCYIVGDDEKVVIIDPAANSKRIIEAVASRKVAAILLTHGHFDHMAALDKLVAHYQCKVYVSEEDEKMLHDERLNGSYKMNNPFTVSSSCLHYPNNELQLDGFNFKLYLASGHTEGSTLLIFEDVMFSGDVLFKESVGRCDLPTGSNSKMVNALNMIKNFTTDYVVYPGHGESTTLFTEFKYNPYLR